MEAPGGNGKEEASIQSRAMTQTPAEQRSREMTAAVIMGPIHGTGSMKETSISSRFVGPPANHLTQRRILLASTKWKLNGPAVPG